MTDHFEIILSRSTPKVKNKVFQLLHRQGANMVYNAEEGIYEIQMKIVSHSQEILDQIAKSLTETVEQIETRPHQYSFSRVLDPLEIYQNNIKAETQVNYQALQAQLSTAIDNTFLAVKQSITSKCKQRYQNPEVLQTPDSPTSPTSAQFKEFLERKMSNVHTSADFQIIVQQNQESQQQKSQTNSSIGLSRIMPKKMSFQTSGSQDMISYFRRLVRGQK